MSKWNEYSYLWIPWENSQILVQIACVKPKSGRTRFTWGSNCDNEPVFFSKMRKDIGFSPVKNLSPLRHKGKHATPYSQWNPHECWCGWECTCLLASQWAQLQSIVLLTILIFLQYHLHNLSGKLLNGNAKYWIASVGLWCRATELVIHSKVCWFQGRFTLFA